MRLCIIGHARHGKDTVAELINKHYFLKFKSSSEAASEIFIYDALKDKYNYKTPIECFEDRINHRKEWHDLICEYNSKTPYRLAKNILKNNDMYIGMRSDIELTACKKLNIFDLIIGVYDNRKLEESKESFNIDFWNQCDIIIPNCGTLEELEERVIKLFNNLKFK